MLSIICSFILFIASAFHFYWGFGGRYGSNVSIPQYSNGARVFNPSSSLTIIVGVTLIGGAVSILAVANYVTLPIPTNLLRAAVALLMVVFVIRAMGWFHYVGFFKKIRSTPFARYDTWFYCPLFLFLSISLGYILINT